MDIRVNNCIVEKKISWIAPDYKKPKVREESYIVIFSGHTKNVTYDYAVGIALFDEEGWFVEYVDDCDDLEIHYYADIPLPPIE